MVPRCKFGSWGSGGGAPRVLQAVAPGVRAAARVGARCRSEGVPRLRSGGCEIRVVGQNLRTDCVAL